MTADPGKKETNDNQNFQSWTLKNLPFVGGVDVKLAYRWRSYQANDRQSNQTEQVGRRKLGSEKMKAWWWETLYLLSNILFNPTTVPVWLFTVQSEVLFTSKNCLRKKVFNSVICQTMTKHETEMKRMWGEPGSNLKMRNKTFPNLRRFLKWPKMNAYSSQ